MTSPILLTGLSKVADDYDVLLCDIWGVIHNGVAHFPPAVEALRRFKAERGPVVLISNSPRPHDMLEKQLNALGVFEEAYSHIVSSGDATRVFLREYASRGTAYKIGPDRDDHIYAGIRIDLSGTAQTAAFISCTGLFDDENETVADYVALLEPAAERGVPMICANPDRIVQRGDRIILCAGSLADLYESMGGPVIMAGKPYAPIYDLCYQAVAEITGAPVAKSRVLAIGDGLPTDVRGANAQGLDLLFIAAGIHAEEAKGADGQLDALKLASLLTTEQAEARYVATQLSWL